MNWSVTQDLAIRNIPVPTLFYISVIHYFTGIKHFKVIYSRFVDLENELMSVSL